MQVMVVDSFARAKSFESIAFACSYLVGLHSFPQIRRSSLKLWVFYLFFSLLDPISLSLNTGERFLPKFFKNLPRPTLNIDQDWACLC